MTPGLIDIRVRLNSLSPESITATHQAAQAGGITRWAVVPNDVCAFDQITHLSHIKYHTQSAVPIAAVTRNCEGRELTEMALLADSGAVAFSDGTKAIASAAVMRRALTYAKMLNKPIIVHPEEPTLASGVMNAGETATRLGLAGIPRLAEVMMIERDLRLVEMTGGRIHFANVSTAEGVEAIRQAKKRGLPVTCDTAPPYFALTDLDVGEYNTAARLSPPLRRDEDRQAVIVGLADDTIDIIASDHTPVTVDDKRLPFAQAIPGAIGLETLLPLTLELVHKNHLSLDQALKKLTIEPAKLLGVSPVGQVLIDPEAPWVIQAEQLLTPFHKRPVQGKISKGNGS